ncbi:aldo/keto reductase [Listeria weihenstephanensis]|uniref:Aldo/keto reductase n=2 Tax=Listeria weihenstephanensis TaxID=1006155 RepID=A0A841Z9P1_9LIST|nr:aldo/keto reductase [Listeria weihenstephanensis]
MEVITMTNEINISRLGLGWSRMTNKTDSASRAESIKTIHTALDAGINLIHTADFHGAGYSEMLVGEALQGSRRDQAFISLKFGALMASRITSGKIILVIK